VSLSLINLGYGYGLYRGHVIELINLGYGYGLYRGHVIELMSCMIYL